MDRQNIRILIVGAGVIGSIYAARLSKAGYSVTIYARSQRLAELQQYGLVYNNTETDMLEKADVRIIGVISDDDCYDYVFVTVRYEQMEAALEELRGSSCNNIVTMVNNPFGYEKWEEIVGKGRIIPAFPGAGGKIERGVLYYRLTPGFVQPTTFGELSGERSDRVIRLQSVLKSAGFPSSICNDMDAWQKSHLAMVIPMANSIYHDGGNNYTTARNKAAIHNMSLSLNENFRFLQAAGIVITPPKLNIFRLCPVWLLDKILRKVYNTKFAETLISNHAIKAKREMDMLSKDFAELAGSKGINLKHLIFKLY